MPNEIAKVFMNGRSQAVRLPKEFRFESEEVYIKKVGNTVILSEIKPTWDEFFNQASAFGDDFLAIREDMPAQEREYF